MTAPYISGTEGRVGSMSDDEIELHKRNALKMSQQGASLAQIKAYMDSAGVPQKRSQAKVDYSPGMTKDYLLGGVMSALHGATFGWDDEGVGSLYGLVTGAGAQAGRDVYRQRLAQFHDQNPGTDLALQIAGGIATGGLAGGVKKLVAPKAMEWLSNLPGVVKAVGAAGAGGGAYAAGDATGGLPERAAAIPGGAATGAVLGGALTGGVVAAGTVLKPILRAIPGVSKAFRTADEMADHIVADDLLRDKANIPTLLDKARAMHAQGLTPTLPDLAGEVTVGRMSAAQAASTAGRQGIKQGLEDRQMGASDRLLSWLEGKTKLGLGNVEQVRNGILGARSQQAEQLYADAYQQAAPMTEKLKALFQNDRFKKAYNEARVELRQSKGIDVPPLVKPFFPEGSFKTPGQAGPAEAIYPPDLPIAGLDWTKRYLDKAIRRGFGSESGFDRGVASGLSDQLKQALTEIDDLVPAYGLARKTYRGDSEVIDALDEGRKFLRTSADKVQLAVQGHSSQAESEAFKLGAIESIRDAIYSKAAKAPDIAKAVFGSPEMKRRIQFLFGPDADEFLSRVRTEARFAEVFRGTQGSRTAPLLGMMENTEAQASNVIGNLLAGRPGTAMVRAIQAGGGKLKIGHGEEVATALANRYQLGLSDPAELIGYLLNLQSRTPRASRVPYLAAALGGQTVAGSQ